MRIERVDVFGYDLTYVHGEYRMSAGRVITRLPSTVVRVVTDEGIHGFGEVCPLGPAYLPAFAGGARAALRELATAVVGADATDLAAVNDRMDAALSGHAYAKSPIDVACWDVLGKAAGQSLTTLLGGRRQDSFPLYIAVPQGSAEEMAEYVRARRAEGLHRFQLKIGGEPAEDAERVRRVLEATGDDDLVVADANGGWRLRDALTAARLLDPLPRLFLEQPCPTLEECRSVRAVTSLPFVLDEVVTDVRSLLAGVGIQGVAAVNVKISKVGGITRARVIRDLAEALGVSLTIEDTWGGDLVTAAVSHLAASTSATATFTVSFMNDWTQEHVAGYRPRSARGIGSAPTGPGLGVAVDLEMLGEPLFSVARA